MHECQRFHDLIAAYLVGDVGPADLEDLGAHSLKCEECRGLLELHRSFATMASELVEPSEEAFEAMRDRVLDQIEANRVGLDAPGPPTPVAAARRPRFRLALAGWLDAHPILAPGLVVLLLVATGLVGRWTAASPWSGPSLLRAVEEQAGGSVDLAGFWDAPFTFANVAVRETGAGDLALGFDVCRHIEAETPRSSALAREVLLATIIDSPTLGMRLKAMEVAPGLEDPRLVEALIYALHNDPNLAVRLRALEVLTRGPLDPTIQDALLMILRDDASVQMRLKALEALAAQRVDPEAIRRALSEAGAESNPVIWQLATEMGGEP